MALCEVAFSDGSDLVAKKMEFGQGWNSLSHTSPLFVILLNICEDVLVICDRSALFNNACFGNVSVFCLIEVVNM